MLGKNGAAVAWVPLVAIIMSSLVVTATASVTFFGEVEVVAEAPVYFHGQVPVVLRASRARPG